MSKEGLIDEFIKLNDINLKLTKVTAKCQSQYRVEPYKNVLVLYANTMECCD